MRASDCGAGCVTRCGSNRRHSCCHPASRGGGDRCRQRSFRWPPSAGCRRGSGRCCAAGRRGGANRAHAGSTASNFRVAARGTAVLLTPREIEVLGALRNGLTNKETARLLGIFAAYRQVPHRSAVPKARRRVSGRSRCQGASSRSSNSKSRVPNRDGSRLLRRAGLLGERRHSTKGQSRTSPQAWPCRRRTPVAMARRRPE